MKSSRLLLCKIKSSGCVIVRIDRNIWFRFRLRLDLNLEARSRRNGGVEEWSDKYVYTTHLGHLTLNPSFSLPLEVHRAFYKTFSRFWGRHSSISKLLERTKKKNVTCRWSPE